MSKTKIEWVKNPDGSQGETINPVKGLCPMACSYCYARTMYKRFKWNPDVRWKAVMDKQVTLLKKPSRIFVGSTIELFGDWIRHEWMEHILQVANLYKEHTFIFLTKQPQNLIKWSPFPDNCWVGVSIDNRYRASSIHHLSDLKATVKFASFEPLLGKILREDEELMFATMLKNIGINWIIIGQQTPVSKKTEPKIEWIREIVDAANKAGVPVFLKDNLKPLLTSDFMGKPVTESHDLWAFKYFKLRQEFPI